MSYTAIMNVPGYLPDTADEIPTFDTPAEAWRHLVDSLGDDAWQPDDPMNDPEGPHSLTPLAVNLEKAEEKDRTGTIYGDIDGLEYAFEVYEAE